MTHCPPTDKQELGNQGWKTNIDGKGRGISLTKQNWNEPPPPASCLLWLSRAQGSALTSHQPTLSGQARREVNLRLAHGNKLDTTGSREESTRSSRIPAAACRAYSKWIICVYCPTAPSSSSHSLCLILRLVRYNWPRHQQGSTEYPELLQWSRMKGKSQEYQGVKM